MQFLDTERHFPHGVIMADLKGPNLVNDRTGTMTETRCLKSSRGFRGPRATCTKRRSSRARTEEILPKGVPLIKAE